MMTKDKKSNRTGHGQSVMPHLLDVLPTQHPLWRNLPLSGRGRRIGGGQHPLSRTPPLSGHGRHIGGRKRKGIAIKEAVMSQKQKTSNDDVADDIIAPLVNVVPQATRNNDMPIQHHIYNLFNDKLHLSSPTIEEVTSSSLPRCPHLEDSFCRRCKAKCDIHFERRIEDLCAYKEHYGHVRVKVSDDRSLYQFCNEMRKARKNHPKKTRMAINDERIASLDALGFDWTVADRGVVKETKSFEQRIEDLHAYKEHYGHVRVKVSNDRSLYYFCNEMRKARKNPEKSRMVLNDERIASLDALGFDWSVVERKCPECRPQFCSQVWCWRTPCVGEFCGMHSSQLVCLHEGCTQTVKEFGLCIKHDIALEEAILEEAESIRGGAGSPTNNNITIPFGETPSRRARHLQGGETPRAFDQQQVGQEEQDDEEDQDEHQQYQNHQEQNQSNQPQDSRRIRESIGHNIDLQLGYLVQPTDGNTALNDILQGCALVIEGTLIGQDGNNKNEDVKRMIGSFGGTVDNELSKQERKFVLSLSSKLYSLVFILTNITSSSLRNSTCIVST